ncbi:uncharacterized protein [Amphiura filiformis]|uniref:uncharacterized protein isoform X2 n=1 Tax=Amphiura filiformis TaxID=82378 RepID=UPI003B2125DE
MRKRFSLLFLMTIIFGHIDTSLGQTEDVKNVSLYAGNLTATICSNHHTCNTTTKQSNLYSRRGCHCDSACQYFNDCCYDYITTYNAKIENALRRSIFDDHVIKLKDWECLELNQASYWVVSRCDTGVTGIIAERCHNPVCNDTLSSVPVTDTNGITYRNVYCAMCHNVEMPNLTAWKVEASCDPAMELLLEDSNLSAPDMDVICSTCKVSISVPQTLIENPIASRICKSNMISTCHKTELAVQDSKVQAMCDSYTAMISINGTIYKNPHCFMCNHATKRWQNQTLNCDGDDIPQLRDDKFMMQSTKTAPSSVDTSKNGKNPQGTKTYKPSVNGIPLSIILDFGSGESSSLRIYHKRKVIKETLVSCPPGEVYAEVSGRGECFALSCPLGATYIDGACVPVLPSKLPERNDIEWCEAITSGDFVTFTATLISPFSCHDQSLNSDCLLDILHLPETSRSCKQPQSNISEILLQIDNTTFRNIHHSFDQMSSAGQFGNITKIDLCGISKLTLMQSCLDQNDLQSCSSSVWISSDDITIRQINDTKYIYHNVSQTWHENNNLVIRDIYTITSSGIRKHSEMKLCNTLPLFECPLVTLNSSLFATSDDDNETITYLPDGRQFGAREYTITSNGDIKVCNFLDQWSLKNETRYESFFTYSEIQTLVSMIGTIISMIAAAATFITFAVFPSLTNTTSRLIMNLTAALFSSQLLLLVAGIASNNNVICFGVAVVSHYTWLAVFASMNALAFDLDRTFGHSENLQSLSNNKKCTTMYILYSWSIPLLAIVPCVFIHYCQCTPRVELRYGGNGVCWISNGIANLVVFATPAGTLLLVNLLLYAHTVSGIWATKRATNRVNKDGSAMKTIIKELGIYVKLSTLMGFTWIFGYVASFTGIEVIWYIFIILNSLQGLFIFMSFTFNRRVAALWKKKLTWSGQPIRLNLRFGNERNQHDQSSSSTSNKVTTLSYYSYVSNKAAYVDAVNQIGSCSR